MNETKTKFEEWAIVEVMGHSRYAGLVTEASIGGASFIRVDVPAVESEMPGVAGMDAFTKYLGASSIFAITPCTEVTARAAAIRFAGRPVDVWGFEREIDRQRALPAPVTAGGPGDEDDEDDDEDFDDCPPMPF